MLNELDALNLIRKKRYPYVLGGTLCVLTCLALTIEFVAGASHKYLFTTLGTELLFYMLVNAISCLLVPDMWIHVKKTIPLYLVNLAITGSLIYLFIDGAVRDHRAFFPALGALVFCFFASMVLIMVIRMVASFLKQE
ncbi:MAG TPA: hypothetical protein PK511_13695 [Chitinophagales bacterium]|nr:hypothetical protein [Chitinophagales bacterium]HNF70493.1 hypothetical protein [Chitinophagales bacterium]HNI55574.1 hypothetical protein [Chitinophagales bacterium]HNJ90708.1 hypothetical protein [Chitinophagales bacterium]HNM28754.1 hypothetical protein [Chitinophagales bacterium]